MTQANVAAIRAKYVEQIQHIKTKLATEFEIPAQSIINHGFACMGIERFDRQGNDLWEMITCAENGWEYERPAAHLVERWARY